MRPQAHVNFVPLICLAARTYHYQDESLQAETHTETHDVVARVDMSSTKITSLTETTNFSKHNASTFQPRIHQHWQLGCERQRPAILTPREVQMVEGAVLSKTSIVTSDASEDVVVPVPRRLLLGWNIAMFFFHTALVVATFFGGSNIDLEVPLYKTVIDFRWRNNASAALFLNQTMASNVTDNTTELGWDLIPLYEESGSPLNHSRRTPLYTRHRASFEFHASMATTSPNWRGVAHRRDGQNISSARPVMILLIAYTLGVRSRDTLIGIVALIAITMPFGYWTEGCPAAIERRVEHWTLLPHISMARRTFAQITAWALIISSFTTARSRRQNPWFVHMILWGEFVLFFSFAASLVSQLYALFERGAYFPVLSLVSKGLLGLILLTNVLMLSRFADLYEDAADDQR